MQRQRLQRPGRRRGLPHVGGVDAVVAATLQQLPLPPTLSPPPGLSCRWQQQPLPLPQSPSPLLPESASALRCPSRCHWCRPPLPREVPGCRASLAAAQVEGMSTDVGGSRQAPADPLPVPVQRSGWTLDSTRLCIEKPPAWRCQARPHWSVQSFWRMSSASACSFCCTRTSSFSARTFGLSSGRFCGR